MTAARILVLDWTRRDRLSVLVVALAVAFLAATAILLAGTTGAATALAGEATAPTVTSVPPGTELHLTTVPTTTGPVTILGGPTPLPRYATDVPAFPTTGVLATAPAPATLTLTESGRVLEVHTADHLFVPTDWVLANATLPATVGDPETYYLRATEAPVPPGTPLQAVAPFFAAVGRQLQAIVLALAAGTTVLVAVTTYSLTRLTIQDRRDTIAILRATGASPRRVGSLLIARTLLVVGVGVATGYAAGVILTNAAINAAVTLGTPTTLSGRVSAAVAADIGLAAAVVLAGAAIAAIAAVTPLLRAAPARIIRSTRPRHWPLPWGRPRVLDARAIVPTAATLAAFLAFLAVLAALTTTVGPALGAGTATITEPGSPHPIASRVPLAYAEALQASGVPASPEILALAVHDGTPYLVRGIDWPAYTSVTEATLQAGTAPTTRGEAVIGADLAATLDVGVGETLLLGGSTTMALTRVTVVGTYTAPGLQDDQLLVTRGTAAHLTDRPPAVVQFIRTDPQPATGVGDARVVAVAIPQTASTATTPTARVTVLNPTTTRTTTRVTVTVDGRTSTHTVTVPAFTHHTTRIPLPVDGVGTHSVTVANTTSTLTVRPADALQLVGLPAVAPPESDPLVRVETVAGAPVDATVHLDGTTYRTGADGTVRLPLDTPGETTVRVTAGDRETTATVTVDPDATRRLQTTLTTTPAHPSVFDPVTATITLTNPWNHSLTRSLTLAAPTPRSATITVPPGQTRTIRVDQGRLAPGDYELALTLDGRVVAETTVTIRGGDRIATALATAGLTRPGSGLGQAARALVGNLGVLVAVLLGLGGLMTVGTTTAALTQSVAANRRTIAIHRATGASPTQVIGHLLADSLRVGAPAILLAAITAALGLATLDRRGVLTVAGIHLDPWPTPVTLVVVLLAATAVLVVAALLTAVAILARPPATQFDGGDRHG
ncbi:MAG: FtsX-like permease family protein [Halobacteriaceae archaeon]